MQVTDPKFWKVERYHQTLCHVPTVWQATEWIGCCVTLLYKEACQSIIPMYIWCYFLTWTTMAMPKYITNFSSCMEKVSWIGGNVSEIWMPVCHHWGFKRHGWCSRSWKRAIHYWASWTFSVSFRVCLLRKCHSSTLTQTILPGRIQQCS
jgi:hypothetical protein